MAPNKFSRESTDGQLGVFTFSGIKRLEWESRTKCGSKRKREDDDGIELAQRKKFQKHKRSAEEKTREIANDKHYTPIPRCNHTDFTKFLEDQEQERINAIWDSDPFINPIQKSNRTDFVQFLKDKEEEKLNAIWESDPYFKPIQRCNQTDFKKYLEEQEKEKEDIQPYGQR